jgi:hypothetical protein
VKRLRAVSSVPYCSVFLLVPFVFRHEIYDLLYFMAIWVY